MTKIKVAGVGIFGMLLASSIFANGLNEDQSYRHRGVAEKMLHLNEEIIHHKLKNHGFNTTFITNIGVQHVGDVIMKGGVKNDNSSTSIANMTQITGDNNTVMQDATNSRQRARTASNTRYSFGTPMLIVSGSSTNRSNP